MMDNEQATAPEETTITSSPCCRSLQRSEAIISSIELVIFLISTVIRDWGTTTSVIRSILDIRSGILLFCHNHTESVQKVPGTPSIVSMHRGSISLPTNGFFRLI